MQTHETTREEIETTYTHIHDTIRDGLCSSETAAEVQAELEGLEDDLSYILGERGFEEYVAERLEYYRRETDKALCSCSRMTCPLKRGEVPPEVKQPGAVLTGREPPSKLVTEYLQSHDGGEAIDLARKEWARMVVRVDLKLSDLSSRVREQPSVSDVERNLGLDDGSDASDAEEAEAD